MPIYAYKCSACQHELDVLQKVSDAPLTVCPQCGAPALAKQLTAAGFQLKGSGWYATDFKNGAPKPDTKAGAKPAEGAAAGADAAPKDASAPPKDGAPAAAAASSGSKDAAPSPGPSSGPASAAGG
jgi:putative FmdB family regulatory protein